MLGVVAALGIWFGLGAVVGRGIANGTGIALGVLRLLVPLALLGAGIALIRGPRTTAEQSDAPKPNPEGHTSVMDVSEIAASEPPAPHHSPRRTLSGLILSALVVVGLAHLMLAGEASVDTDGIDAFSSAGGLAGASTAGALASAIGTIGAIVLLVLLGVLAISLLSGRSLKQMAQWISRATNPALAKGGGWLSGLFRIGADDSAEPADDSSLEAPSVDLYDQDDGDESGLGVPSKPASKTRKTKPKVSVGQEEPDMDPTQLDLDLGPLAKASPWKLPARKLLSVSNKRSVDTKIVEERGRVLESALADHGVQTRLVGMVVGPTVTRYELELGTGVKVSKVTSLNRDIAYAMASADVRILAPIPGRQAIGVEVPNSDRQVVALGDILTSEEAQRATHPLEVGVGRDINGRAVLMNLATMPHLLIAGQTGSGKSSCINSIITSVMMRSTPEEVKLILIDPKRVELTQYDRIPHLLTQVVTNPKKAANALNWAVKEMERRYDILSEVGVRDITGYNAAFDRGDFTPKSDPDGEAATDSEVRPSDADSGREHSRLPFILVVVDELSDLMMVAARDVEDSICRIAQMARAVGIHLVIATQRPSVNVITGVIKANIPARLAFAVSSATDSKVILDQGGAERLIGQGDMLLLGPASSAPQRIQGAWVEESEVRSISSFWKKQAPNVEQFYEDDVEGSESGDSGVGGTAGRGSDDDELYAQALELVVRSGLGSTSMLQRKLKVGFARAGRLMDLLEQRGLVGPSEGSKAREVLLTEEDFQNMSESGQL